MAHQIAPGVDRPHLVAAPLERGDDVGPVARFQAQRSRLLARRASEEPARGLHGLLGPHAAVDQARHQGRLGLWLALATHRSVDHARPASDEIHRGDQGVGRVLARGEPVRMGGVEREERAAVLEQDTGVAGDDPRPELVVEALDERDSVAVGIRGDDGDGIALDGPAGKRRRRARSDTAAPLSQARRVEAVLDRHGHQRGIRQVAIAILEGELGRLDGEVNVLVLGSGRDVEALEQGQDGQCGETLCGWRKARRLAAAIGHRKRRDPVGTVRVEIAGGQRAARLAGGPRDAAGQIPPVELLRATRGDQFQSLREVGLGKALPGEAIGVEDWPQRAPDLVGSRRAEERRRRRGHPPLARRWRKSLARVPDGGFEQLAPGNGRGHAVGAVAMRVPPARYRARGREGRRPPARGDDRAMARAVVVEIDAARRSAGRVEGEERPRPSVEDHPEAVAANSVHVRIHDGDGGRGGHGGVDRVPAAREDGLSGLRREVVGREHEAANIARLGPASGSAHAAMIAPCYYRLMPDASTDLDTQWWYPDGRGGRLPLGAPFRPGLDPLPHEHEAWAVVKDRWGRPAHGEPRDALRRVVAPVPAIGPNDALCYVLYAGLTYNTVFAARGVPISVFDLHDQDLHIPGSGATVLVAALGAEVARQGRLRLGELRVVYPGASDLLSPRAGDDPMHADFKIQGYETPDGTFAQFVRCQAPALLAHSARLNLADAASFMLDLETVYKALYAVAGLEPGERVFVEGAAGGTGLHAVGCAVLRGASVTGLVSTEEKGALIRARGATAHVNRAVPELKGVFSMVPFDAPGHAEWRAAGEGFAAMVREANGGAAIDVVVSSVGRDLFGRMVELLGPGGRIVFYGATSGYTLAFLGKPGAAGAREMMARAALRPHEGVLVYWGAATQTGARGSAPDPVGDEVIEAALRAGARVAAVTGTDQEGASLQSRFALRGVVSLEALARSPGFRWPDAMPDYDLDAEGYRAYQDATLKPFGQAVGRLLATADNPRGYPDLIVERPARDTLGVSAFIARPHGGRIIYLEAGKGRRFSFYAPNVWMHQKRILFPDFAILGSHLSNAHQASEVVQLIDGAAPGVHPPAIQPWEELAEANQAMHENRHTGTLAVRVAATAALDGARSARQVYEAWGSRFLDTSTVRVRLDPVRPGFPDLVALVTIDSPPANALGRGTLDDLEEALDRLEAEPSLRAVVLTGAGSMFVAGADVRQLRAIATPGEVESLAARAQRVFARIAASRAPFVSAVDGYALGGGNELQMACAYRVASPRAEIGQPEINLHIIPGFGGTQMLPRLAVRHAARVRGAQVYTLLARAMTLLLDGRRRPATEAQALGLVDEVAPADALGHALGIAGRIARGEFSPALWSPLNQTDTLAFPNVERDPDVQRALAHHEQIPRRDAARAIVDIARLGFTKGIAAGLQEEARVFGRLVASDDGRAGIDRFLARRSLPLPLRPRS